jgi:hypothetical protein
MRIDVNVAFTITKKDALVRLIMYHYFDPTSADHLFENRLFHVDVSYLEHAVFANRKEKTELGSERDSHYSLCVRFELAHL